jgi:hypothetical protein
VNCVCTQPGSSNIDETYGKTGYRSYQLALIEARVLFLCVCTMQAAELLQRMVRGHQGRKAGRRWRRRRKELMALNALAVSAALAIQRSFRYVSYASAARFAHIGRSYCISAELSV